MRRLLALPATLLLLASIAPTAVGATPPTVTLESQSWWRKAGIIVPTQVGAHVHVKATVPADGTIVDGYVNVPITITLHDAAGKTNWFRMGSESVELYKRDVVLGPCLDCTVSFDVALNLGRLSTGRHELRMSANVVDEDPGLDGAQRMYQSTGYQVCVRSCSPTYRDATPPSVEGRGWYTGHDYQNAKFTTNPWDIHPGRDVGVRISGDTTFGGLYIDPNFHAGSEGVRVRTWSGNFTGKVLLPTNVAPGLHRLVLVSSDSQSAGVIVAEFSAP